MNSSSSSRYIRSAFTIMLIAVTGSNSVTNILQNICGVSVVDGDFEKLKRFNLAEIFEPTPREVIREAENTLTDPVEEYGLVREEAGVAGQESTPSTMDTT